MLRDFRHNNQSFEQFFMHKATSTIRYFNTKAALPKQSGKCYSVLSEKGAIRPV